MSHLADVLYTLYGADTSNCAVWIEQCHRSARDDSPIARLDATQRERVVQAILRERGHRRRFAERLNEYASLVRSSPAQQMVR